VPTCDNADHAGIQPVLCDFRQRIGQILADVRNEGVDQSVAVERVADLSSLPIKM
jgi:hypothetical protein